MNLFRRGLGAALLLLMLTPAFAQEKGAAVQVKPATLDELNKTIQSFKGKVVVVDFWSTT
jgi:hypothetical protein